MSSGPFPDQRDVFSTTLADAMPQIVWTANPDGWLDYYNQHWVTYTGMTVAETQGWGWGPVLHPDDLDNCVAVWKRSVETGAPYEVEYRFKRAADGAYRWHLGRALPVRDAQGNIIKWFGTCTDIQDQKEALALIEQQVKTRTAELATANDELRREIARRKEIEDTLQRDTLRLQELTAKLMQSESEIRAVVEGVADGIITLDHSGTIETFNGAASAMFGYAADEVVGTHVSRLVPDAMQTSDDPGMPRVMAGAESVAFGKGTVELPGLRKDGSTFRLDLGVTELVIEGRRVFVGILRDITERKRAQEELDRFFQLSLDMLCIASFDGYFKRLNPAWETTLGFTREELMAEPFLDFVHPDDRDATMNSAQNLSQGNETRFFENRYRCKDGSYKWLVWQAAPATDASLIYAAAHDITDRRVAQETLQAQTARLTEAQRIARLGNWEWDIASDTLRWSDEMYRVFGVAPAEFSPNYAGFLSLVHPDDRDRVEAQVGKGLTERIPMIIEHRAVLRDGTIRHIHARNQVLLDATGAVVKLVGTAQDVTERSEVEDALRISEERLQIVAQATNDVIWDWDLATGTIAFNKGMSDSADVASAQYNPGLGFDFQNIHSDDHDRVKGSLEDFIAGPDTAWSEQYRLHQADASYSHVFNRARAVRDATGKATRLVGSMMNITAQKQQEEELREAKDAAESASRAKGEFLANMSHEIRTPMNGVLGTLGLLLDSTLSPVQRELAGLARDSGESLLSLMNDILDFSKIEAGKLSIEILPFDLLRVAEDVTDLMATLAAGKNLDLILRYAPDVPRHVIGDPGRIRQVLTNLLSNAIKFTDSGQVLLDIDAETIDAHRVSLRFRVEDTGIGIAPEQVTRIFEKFTQADASTTRRHGGTGLGLAISSQLVEMMGGQIGAESRPGAGATFWFTLDLDRPVNAPAPALPPADLAGVRVLIVDDNAVNRRVLHEQILGLQMRNGSCASADEALRSLREAHAAGDPYRIAILDYQMPGTDGERLGRAIKEDPQLRDTILVMLTSVGHRGEVARLKTLGFAAYLVKPVRQSELLGALSAVWSARNQEQDADMVTRHTLLEDLTLRGPAPPARCFIARVLLAEDHPTNQLVASMMLRNLGCEVEIAVNGHQAVEMQARTLYDVVFMDCEMPVMDGFAAAAEIRSREAGTREAGTRRVPIVAVTAQAMQGDRERCLAAGMDDYISKPVHTAAFAAALQRWAPDRQIEPSEDVRRSSPEAATPSHPDAEPLDPTVVARLRALAQATDSALFGQIYRSFQQETVARIAMIHDAAHRGDAAVLHSAAHTLKGASANIGARHLAALAAMLEALGQRGAMTGAPVLAERLRHEHTRVDTAIRALDDLSGASTGSEA